jgi:transcriptional regulator with XRE-family HTH domain
MCRNRQPAKNQTGDYELLLPFRSPSSRAPRDAAEFPPNLGFDPCRPLSSMDDMGDEARANPQPLSDAALDSAIKSEHLEGRDGNLLGGASHKVDLIPTILVPTALVRVKRKMPPKPKNLDHLPELARRLVAFRKRLGLNQEEMAEKLGMSQQNVSSWESNNSTPTIDGFGMLMELARVKELEEYRAYFLDEVRRALVRARIPVDELRRTYTPQQRENMKRRA